MKILGQILMWLGFLSGSLATVFHLPKAGVEFARNLKPADDLGFTLPDMSTVASVEDGWHLIPWTWYILSGIVCLVGVVMIRLGTNLSRVISTEQSTADLDMLQRYLANLIRDSEKLQSQIDSLAPSKITEFIDSVLSGDFLRLRE